MKKSLVALAALAVVGAASAQSSVTLYGIVDANITNQKGADSLTSIGSGGLNGSRWGFRGTEDLGGGLQGLFRLEGGFATDDGTLQQGGRLFGRHATVGLGGGFGAIRIGRNQTPMGALHDQYATLGSKGADLLAVARRPAAAGVADRFLGSSFDPSYRADNSITYDSPNIGGLTFSGQYSLNFNGQEVAARTGRTAGFNVLYNGGPFFGALGYLQTRSAPVAGVTSKPKAIHIGLGYNLGFATVKGMVQRDDLDVAGLSEDPTIIGVEAAVPLGAFTLAAGFARLRDSTGAAGVSDNANLLTLQGVYNLSKRTALYSLYTYVDNNDAARAGYRAPAAGQTSRNFQLGVRHSF